MAKIQKKLEQHPVAKLFPAPDAAALDALRKRIFHAEKLKYRSSSSKARSLSIGPNIARVWNSTCRRWTRINCNPKTV